MGGLRMTRNDIATYEMLSRAGNDIKSGMLQHGLSRAADVNPETVSSTDLTETTPGTSGMTYDQDTGQYLPNYMEGGQPTDQARAQMNADGARGAPEGMRPTFSAKTTTRHRMGDREQDTPFAPEQVQAEAMNRQAGVHLSAGNTREAVGLYGLAKQRTKDAALSAADEATRTGMKTIAQSASAQEKEFKRLNVRYEALANAGLYDEASSVFGQMEKAREGFIKHARNRSEAQYRATGSIAGFINDYNNFSADGQTFTRYQQNQDGSATVFEVNGKALDKPITVSKQELFGGADENGEVRPGLIDSIYDPDKHREFATKYMQAGALKRQESKIAEGAPSKLASTDKDKATAEYYRGAKTIMTQAQANAAQAKADGAGSGLGQQRFDAQQFGSFIKENSSFYELPDAMNEGKYVTNRVARDTFTAAAKRNPELAQQTFAQMRSAAEADATDGEGNVDPQKMNTAYIKRVNEFAKRLVAPSAPAQPKPAPSAANAGMAKQPTSPAAPIPPPQPQTVGKDFYILEREARNLDEQIKRVTGRMNSPQATAPGAGERLQAEVIQLANERNSVERQMSQLRGR